MGLALQYTPHPGLVMIEMASAGMVAVTNRFQNKTPDALRAISPNILAVGADGIAEGLRQGSRRPEDAAARVAGAAVDWPTTWDRALDADLLRRTLGFLEAC